MNIQKPTLSEIIWVKTDQLTLANLPDFSLPILHIHVAYFNHLHVLREEVFTFQKREKGWDCSSVQGFEKYIDLGMLTNEIYEQYILFSQQLLTHPKVRLKIIFI